jgi:hypothetical protein
MRSGLYVPEPERTPPCVLERRAPDVLGAQVSSESRSSQSKLLLPRALGMVESVDRRDPAWASTGQQDTDIRRANGPIALERIHLLRETEVRTQYLSTGGYSAALRGSSVRRLCSSTVLRTPSEFSIVTTAPSTATTLKRPGVVMTTTSSPMWTMLKLRSTTAYYSGIRRRAKGTFVVASAGL